MRRVLLLFLLALGASAVAVPKFSYTGLRVKTLVKNGEPSRKVDLVFVGDGYLRSDLGAGGRYEKSVRSVLTELWSYNVFRDYRKDFNVHLVYLESKKEGDIHYALGSEVSDARRNFAVLKRADKLPTVLANAPEVDAAIVLTTLNARSNSGHGSSGRVLLAEQDTVVLAHELGHLLAGLGDEYSSTQLLWDRQLNPIPKGRDFSQVNLTTSEHVDPSNEKTIAKTAKWGDLLKYPDAFPLISAYQGGYYNEVGVWRPSYECTMRDSRFPRFCPVCHRALAKSISRLCNRRFDEKAYHRAHPYKTWK